MAVNHQATCAGDQSKKEIPAALDNLFGHLGLMESRLNPAVRGRESPSVPCTGVVLPPDSENKSERK
jgi:hypothetical protein